MSSGLDFCSVRSVRPNAPDLPDIPASVRETFETIRPILRTIPRGARIAVTAGSRGIDRISEVIREICCGLREAGADPFVVPAMGSHGGATAEGQRRLLEHLGVSEDRIGAPVVSSMEAVPVAHTPSGIEVFMDRAAWECGRVFAVNRVKPHTDFDGVVESGLLKVLAVGLGKLLGATSFHRSALAHGYERTLLEMSRCSLASGKVIAGLGVVENDRHVICEMGAAPGPEIEDLDRRLQARARELYPRLPFTSVDLLIVDEFGKNISGTGMDAKVIGRPVHPDLAPRNGGRIQVRRIYVRDLTEESEGNATGIGLADLIHCRVAKKIDFTALYTNAGTSLAPNVARMPMQVPNDRAGLELLARNMGFTGLAPVRAVWIRNTLAINNFRATPGYANELRDNSAYELGQCSAAAFDDDGNLPGLAPAANATAA